MVLTCLKFGRFTGKRQVDSNESARSSVILQIEQNNKYRRVWQDNGSIKLQRNVKDNKTEAAISISMICQILWPF